MIALTLCVLNRLSRVKSFPGGDGGGVTPVPISNTEVKPSSADGTALETRWESRKLPGFCLEPSVNPGGSLYFPRKRGGSDSAALRNAAL